MACPGFVFSGLCGSAGVFICAHHTSTVRAHTPAVTEHLLRARCTRGSYVRLHPVLSCRTLDMTVWASCAPVLACSAHVCRLVMEACMSCVTSWCAHTHCVYHSGVSAGTRHVCCFARVSTSTGTRVSACVSMCALCGCVHAHGWHRSTSTIHLCACVLARMCCVCWISGVPARGPVCAHAAGRQQGGPSVALARGPGARLLHSPSQGRLGVRGPVGPESDPRPPESGERPPSPFACPVLLTD